MAFSEDEIQQLGLQIEKKYIIHRRMFVLFLILLAFLVFLDEFYWAPCNEVLTLPVAVLGTLTFVYSKFKSALEFAIKFCLIVFCVGIYSHFLQLTLIFLSMSDSDNGLASGPLFLLSLSSFLVTIFSALIAVIVNNR